MMMIGLLSDGHLLVEGVPGLAKTTAIKALSDAIDTSFSRIQFTRIFYSDLWEHRFIQAVMKVLKLKKANFCQYGFADEINCVCQGPIALS